MRVGYLCKGWAAGRIDLVFGPRRIKETLRELISGEVSFLFYQSLGWDGRACQRRLFGMLICPLLGQNQENLSFIT